MVRAPQSNQHGQNDEQSKPSELVADGKAVIIARIIPIVVAVIAFFFGFRACSNMMESPEPTFESVTYQLATRNIRSVMDNSGISDYENLYYYYPYSYTVKDDVYIFASKLDFWGTSHSYSVGVRFLDNDVSKPDVVFIRIDNQVLLDER